nr:peptidylprolyl isomerase [Neisseria zalophi]
MMKKTYIFTALAVALTTTGLLAAGTPPEIDRARIDSMVAQELQRADALPAAERPDGETLRKNVTTHLQTVEMLKNEAFKLGLEKLPEVQSQFKNAEAEFYAGQYVRYLENNTEVSEADLRTFYDQQTRLVKLQQVGFATQDEARKAQELLLKGLSFDDLMKRYPNPDQQQMDQFIPPQMLPPELAGIVNKMTRGQITADPVAMNGQFYLFKLAAAERNPDAQPFNQVRDLVAQQLKQQRVQQQIETLLKDNGIEVQQ